MLYVSWFWDMAHPPWGVRDGGCEKGRAKAQARCRGQKQCSDLNTTYWPLRNEVWMAKDSWKKLPTLHRARSRSAWSLGKLTSLLVYARSRLTGHFSFSRPLPTLVSVLSRCPSLGRECGRRDIQHCEPKLVPSVQVALIRTPPLSLISCVSLENLFNVSVSQIFHL